jgi:hypothetical protein
MWTLLILAALDCYSITDNMDQRLYCQAREQQESGICYGIQDSATRSACRAEIKKDRSICDGIYDINERQLCRSRATN